MCNDWCVMKGCSWPFIRSTLVMRESDVICCLVVTAPSVWYATCSLFTPVMVASLPPGFGSLTAPLTPVPRPPPASIRQGELSEHIRQRELSEHQRRSAAPATNGCACVCGGGDDCEQQR